MSFYGIFFTKNYFDKFYILLTIITVLSWLYSDNYCVLTYYNSPEKNKKDPLEIEDFNNLFDNKYNGVIKKLLFVNVFVYGISLYIVLFRNKYSKLFALTTCLLYVLYGIVLRCNNKKLITLINEILKIAFVIILLLILNKEEYINIGKYIV
jgi:hypothetical protein